MAQFLVDIVNSVEDERKTAALISLIGPKIYKLLKSLTAPDDPSTKAYADLVKLLADHLSLKPLVISERFKFYTRDQKGNDESISEYLADLSSDKAVKIAIASETAAKDVGLLNKGATAMVNKINPRPRKRKGRGKAKGTQG